MLGHVSILAIELELVLNRGSCMKISLKKRHQEPGVFLKLKSPFYHVLQQLVDSVIQCERHLCYASFNSGNSEPNFQNQDFNHVFWVWSLGTCQLRDDVAKTLLP